MAPEILALSPVPLLDTDDVPAGAALDLGNGITLLAARAVQSGSSELDVTVYWQATDRPTHDYAVGAHLLARYPPTGPDDILAQADTQHPVYGWYPTTRWQPGEIVRDDLTLTIPPGTAPIGIRLGMYRQAEDGSFVNSPWFLIQSKEWE
ncbi:MAG: hypothetical protein J7M15_00380, partial [Anaerolineae bacterium]|nr:hypothetical protein [Anaerolineae bacterium]